MAPAGRTDTPADMSMTRVLAVDLDSTAVAKLPRNVVAPAAGIVHVAFADLANVALSGPEAPSLVLSPLLTAGFDALDLAQMLVAGGYRGRYLALVDKLPSAKLIRREVAAQSPDLNFDVIVLDGSSPLHSL
jgi:hypothetical protein